MMVWLLLPGFSNIEWLLLTTVI